jgi:hypothetical protein
MDENLPSKKNINNLIKPASIIIAVFIIGFAFPVLVKNYLGKRAGVAPTPPPSAAKQLTGPYYRFQPETVALKKGETAKVKVFLNTDKKTIEAFDFIAKYDSSVVEVTSVETTPLFPSYPAIEYGNGSITVGGNIGIDKSFSVNDTLLLVTLEGKGKGETKLEVDKDKSTIASRGKNILESNNSLRIKVE